MKEKEVNTEIRKSFEHFGAFAYKIPDLPIGIHDRRRGIRFNPSKPFDIVVCYKGIFIAVETKLLRKFEAFGLRQIRDNQREALDKVSQKAGGYAFIFLNVRIPPDKAKGQKTVNRLYTFHWPTWKALWETNGPIKKRRLEEMNFTTAGKGIFNLKNFFVNIEKFTPNAHERMFSTGEKTATALS